MVVALVALPPDVAFRARNYVLGFKFAIFSGVKLFGKDFEVGYVVIGSGFVPPAKWTEGINNVNIEPGAPLMFDAFFAEPPNVGANGNFERVYVLIFLVVEKLEDLRIFS